MCISEVFKDTDPRHLVNGLNHQHDNVECESSPCSGSIWPGFAASELLFPRALCKDERKAESPGKRQAKCASM